MNDNRLNKKLVIESALPNKKKGHGLLVLLIILIIIGAVFFALEYLRYTNFVDFI